MPTTEKLLDQSQASDFSTGAAARSTPSLVCGSVRIEAHSMARNIKRTKSDGAEHEQCDRAPIVHSYNVSKFYNESSIFLLCVQPS